MPILTRPKLAERLELSETRIQQLTADGVLKRVSGGYDLTASALALLKHSRSDLEGRAIRRRYQAAQSLAVELRVQRQLKRLIHIDEAGWLYLLFLEEAHKAAAGVAARVFADASLRLSDLDARRVATFVDNELHGLIGAFESTIARTLEFVRTEKLPSEGRLDLIARSLLPGQHEIVRTYYAKLTAKVLHDEAKLDDDKDQADKAATTAATSAAPTVRTKRPKSRRRGSAQGAAGDATAKTDGD
jgi:hypothetical protein